MSHLGLERLKLLYARGPVDLGHRLLGPRGELEADVAELRDALFGKHGRGNTSLKGAVVGVELGHESAQRRIGQQRSTQAKR